MSCRLPTGQTYKQITPDADYVEGPFHDQAQGRLLFDVVGRRLDGPRLSRRLRHRPVAGTGPFKPRAALSWPRTTSIARGAGHHSVVDIPGTDDWYIVYHRRPLNDPEGNHRELAIDHMVFNADGSIQPVVMTTEGVAPRPLPKGTK